MIFKIATALGHQFASEEKRKDLVSIDPLCLSYLKHQLVAGMGHGTG